MRIGIDLQVLSHEHLTGVEKYALNITKALLRLGPEHTFIFFVPETTTWPPPHEEGKGEVKFLPKKRIPFFTAHWQYARIMRRARLDVLFGPANQVPWFYKGRVVITIHDLAIYKHPEWFPKRQWFSTKFLVPRSIRRARTIIVPSQITSRDLHELFHLPQEKIVIVPHGVEERFFRKNSPSHKEGKGEVQANPVTITSSLSPPHEGEITPAKYILFVGTLEPRKNVKRLIEAYLMLPEEMRAKYELWIAGEKDVGSEKLGGKIRLLGYVPDEDMPTLIQGATVFVYPSLYEGFGLPVLEAMASGTPVITSRDSSMQEITGDQALLINPLSSEEIRNAIIKYIRDVAYSRQIANYNIQRAHNFTWDFAARKTLLTIINTAMP